MTRRSIMTLVALVGVGLAGVLGLVALRSGDASRGPAVVELLREPIDVPPFTVTDLGGRTLTSSDWRGKVVIVNFWATWCLPCLAEIPDLIALQQKYPEEVVVVGISEDEGPIEPVKRFVAEKSINYPVAMATPELRKAFPGVLALPTTFVLDRDGRMVKKTVGLLNARETETTARALAGLSVDAKIVRVDDPGKLSPESAAQITGIPGLDLTNLPPEKKVAVIQALNAEKCTCGCDLSIAKCRLDDPSCNISLPIAQKILQRHVAAP
jgi:thiol-disulfide isomerase/thioredoxin